MNLPLFKLEKYFEKYEFSAPYMLGSSDAQTFSMQDLLAYSDIETQKLWQELALGYTETHGIPLLRQEISKLYKAVQEQEILVCSGAEEAIYLAMQTILVPNSHVVVITPCYQSLKTLPRSFGAEVTEVELVNQGKWQLNFKALENAIRDNTKLIITNFPHNPTGFLPSRELFEKIVSLARTANAYLFSDEVYRFSEQNVTDRLPGAVDLYDKAISLGVMSKTFGLPGLRIGWVAMHDNDLLEKMASYKNYLTICNSAPSEILSIIALRAKDKIIARNMSIITRNLNLLDTFFAKYKQIFSWVRPIAGITAFPRFNYSLAINEFAKRCVEAVGVLIIPGSLYDNADNYFRIGFGRENMPEALSKFEYFLRI